MKADNSDRNLRSALSRLENLARNRSDLSRLIALNQRLLPILFAEPATNQPLLNIPPDVFQQVSNGDPLLHQIQITFDSELFRRRWLAVCEIVTQQGISTSSNALGAAVDRRQLDPAQQLEIVLSQGTRQFEIGLKQLDLDVSLGQTVLRLCALPTLEPVVRDAELLVRNWQWDRGNCPGCGSWPLVAELRGLERLRWLRCGLCAAQWQVNRLFCPFCALDDHNQLHDLLIEGDEQRYCLSVCERCHGALPSLATLNRLSAPELLVADMETLHLRFIAEQRGYRASPVD